MFRWTNGEADETDGQVTSSDEWMMRARGGSKKKPICTYRRAMLSDATRGIHTFVVRVSITKTW